MYSCISVRSSSSKVAQLSVFALLAATLIHTQLVMAQSSSVLIAKLENDLDPLVVTATRFNDKFSNVNAQIQIISKEEISEIGATSLGEVLLTLGNINSSTSSIGGPLGTGLNIDIRGFGATSNANTVILVDGVRVTAADSSAVRWESIPMNSIERIEIIQGGSAVLYGDRASAGVINIITRPEITQKNSASAQVGSYGFSLLNANLGFEKNSLSTLIQVSKAHVDGWRPQSQNDQGSVRGLFTYKINAKDKLFLDSSYASNSNGGPGYVVGKVNTGNLQATRSINLNERYVGNTSRHLFGIVKEVSSGLMFENEFSYSYTNRTSYTPAYGANYGSASYYTGVYEITPRFKKQWQYFGTSILGFDLREENYTSKTIGVTSREAQLRNTAPYFYQRINLNDQIEFFAGIRHQNQSASARDVPSGLRAQRTQSANANEIGISYRVNKNNLDKFYIKTSSSYRFANTDEYWASTAASSYATYFNSILRPQKVRGIDAGYSGRINNQLNYAFNAYQMNSTDEIRYDGLNFLNTNSDPIQRKGINSSVQYSSTDATRIGVNLTYQTASFSSGSYSGKTVTTVPNILIGLHGAYQVLPKLIISANGNYVGTQFYANDDSNIANKMPAYVLFNLGFGYSPIKELSIQANIKNIFNRGYSNYGYYSSPTSYFYMPGDPRTFYINARYTF